MPIVVTAVCIANLVGCAGADCHGADCHAWLIYFAVLLGQSGWLCCAVLAGLPLIAVGFEVCKAVVS